MKVINEKYNNETKELEIDFIIENKEFHLRDARHYIEAKYKIPYHKIVINYFTIYDDKLFCYFDLLD